MKKTDFQALIKEKQADTNIEYIQPDYQVTVASVKLPQDEEKLPTENTSMSEQQDNTLETVPSDTQAPLLSKLTFDDLKIYLTYDEILNSALLPSSKDFSVKTMDEKKAVIAGLEIKEDSLVITLKAPLAAGESIMLSYTPGTNPIQDQAGNPAKGFTEQKAKSSIVPEVEPETPKLDKDTPILETAEIKDNIIKLKYNEPLKETSIPNTKDFTLVCTDEKGSSLKNKIKDITIKDQEVSLTLEDKLAQDHTMQISYLPGKNPIEDLAGNQAEGISQKEITKQSEKLDKIAPVLQAATINIATLELSYDKQLQEDTLPSDKDFSLCLNGKFVTKAIKSITIAGGKVIIILNSLVSSHDTLILSYTPSKTALQDLAGNIVPEINGTMVKNITPTVINDLRFTEQWALLSNNIDTTTNIAVSVGIDAVNAYQESEGDGVVVAVLDTGIDITHEDLKNNIWTNPAEIPDNGIDDDGNGYVDDVQGWNFADKTNAVHNPDTAADEWHGTHVAGIIAAAKGNQKGVVGVAPKAKIMPLQVFKNGTAYTSDIINAIQYAKQMGAQVLNCSWGTTSENIALNEAMSESGLLFVCAAGNSYKDIDVNPVYPASLTGDNIISVASVNKIGNLSRFSNYGQNSVDVAAPGEEILSTTPGNAYGQSGGTSQAAAFVTGEVALILSKYPRVSISDIRTRVILSADKLSSLIGKVSGGGKINCAAALADPVTHNDNLIQIPAEQAQDPGSGTQDNGDYNLYSVDEWNVGGNLLTARVYFGAVTFNDKIYSVGGFYGGYLNSVEIFDPVSSSSTFTGSLYTARYGLGVAATEGKIYAIGGYNNGYLSIVEEYNPVTSSWSTKANMPTPSYLFGAATVNGKIYAIGGYNGTYLNTV